METSATGLRGVAATSSATPTRSRIWGCPTRPSSACSRVRVDGTSTDAAEHRRGQPERRRGQQDAHQSSPGPHLVRAAVSVGPEHQQGLLPVRPGGRRQAAHPGRIEVPQREVPAGPVVGACRDGIRGDALCGVRGDRGPVGDLLVVARRLVLQLFGALQQHREGKALLLPAHHRHPRARTTTGGLQRVHLLGPHRQWEERAPVGVPVGHRGSKRHVVRAGFDAGLEHGQPRQARRVVRLGHQLAGGPHTGASQADLGDPERSPAGQQQVTPGRVDGRQLPAPVGQQVQPVVADEKPPGLAVVHRRGLGRGLRGGSQGSRGLQPHARLPPGHCAPPPASDPASAAAAAGS